MFKTMLVLESPWDSESVQSVSVWPFMREFANVRGVAAHYQAFTDKSSFGHWVNRYHKEDLSAPKLLYVAAHGTPGRIGGLRKSINSDTILACMAKAKSVEYIYFGSCLFGTKENLTALMKKAKQLKWAAGYESPVEWIDSMAFDLLLLGRLQSKFEDEKGLHFHTVAKKLIAQTRGLAGSLQFRFNYRYGSSIESFFSR